MFNYDPYEGRVPEERNNCFQRAVRIAIKNNVDCVYYMPDVQHYYVVVPGERFAHGAIDHYPQYTAQEVLEFGIKHRITREERAIWGK